jgi:hypothetical protein
LTFAELPPQLIPRCEAFANEQALQTTSHDRSFIAAVLERWRGSMARPGAHPDDAVRAICSDSVPLQPGPAPDSSRFQPFEETPGQPGGPVLRPQAPGLDTEALTISPIATPTHEVVPAKAGTTKMWALISAQSGRHRGSRRIRHKRARHSRAPYRRAR